MSKVLLVIGGVIALLLVGLVFTVITGVVLGWLGMFWELVCRS